MFYYGQLERDSRRRGREEYFLLGRIPSQNFYWKHLGLKHTGGAEKVLGNYGVRLARYSENCGGIDLLPCRSFNYSDNCPAGDPPSQIASKQPVEQYYMGFNYFIVLIMAEFATKPIARDLTVCRRFFRSPVAFAV
jgi:hypothetical protein